MTYRALLMTALTIFVTAGASDDLASAEPNICDRLKEISSDDPEKSILFGHWSREQLCRSYYWSRFRPLPLAKILNGSEHANYRRALASSNCREAAALLRKGFATAHPNAPSILANELDYRSWKSRTVGTYFPALSMCFDVAQLRKAQTEIERLGITAAPYAGHMKSMASKAAKRLPIPVATRHGAIFRMHRNLQKSMSPALALTLLKLSIEGKALKYHRYYERYLALRLRNHGHSDPIVQHVIDRPLDVQSKSEIERRAALGRYKGLPIYAH